PETVPRRSEVWRPAAAARNRRLGRSGKSPAGHYDPAARSSLYGAGGNAGQSEARPRTSKAPRWSAARRAHPAGCAPRFARADRRCASWRSFPLGPPRETETRKTNPGATTRRGNEETALFDIVNRKTRPPGCDAHRGRDALRSLRSPDE